MTIEQRFAKAHHDAFKAFIDELVPFFQSQLTEEVRPYPRETKRYYGRGRTGKGAGSPRDVVDSRGLVGSLVMQMSLSPTFMEAVVAWTAKHSIYVYYGSTSSNGADIPPWPWVENAIARLGGEEGLKRMFLKHLRKALS